MEGSINGLLSSTGESNLKYDIADAVDDAGRSLPFPVVDARGGGEVGHYIGLVDPAHGEFSFSSNLEIPLNAKFVSVINTPEPSTWAIFSIAALGAWCSHRRQIGKRRFRN